MPELPEVQTVVNGLKREVLERTFLGIWAENYSVIKNASENEFKKAVKGRSIVGVKRRAKNILIFLDNKFVILIHLKLTGHLLLGDWEYNQKNNKWTPLTSGPITDDPYNRFIRVIFCLDDNRKIALCDARKFAKIELWSQDDIENKVFIDTGPEPLDENFSVQNFIELFKNKKRGKIKQILMDQSFIAGIGNIYASEILYEAGIDPSEDVAKIDESDLKKIYYLMKEALEKGVEAGGDSFSDFRNIYGEKGKFQNIMKVYGREGKECYNCGGKIIRTSIAARSTFSCSNCQKKKL